MSAALLGSSGAADVAPDMVLRSAMRSARFALAAVVLGLGGAAAIVPIGGAVVASGTVAVEGRNKRIAHPIGGSIAAIYVRDGDRVAAGAPLLRFDDEVTTADAAMSALSVDQLLAQRARLAAEAMDARAVSYPPELAGRTDRAAVAAMDAERKLFAIRTREQAGLAAQLAARVAQYEQQIAGTRAQIAANTRQMALIAPERDGLRRLYEQGLVTLSRKNQLERQAVDYQGGIASLQTQIAQMREKIIETRGQMLQLAQTRRAEAGAELARTEAALNQQKALSASARDRQQRTVVRAPYAGVVNRLAFTAIGDVVRPADTIMEIVPDRSPQVVEVLISPADIERVATGQTVRVRFSSFSGSATTEVSGRLTRIAPDRSIDAESRRPYFTARATFDPRELSRSRLALRPGMPAEVFIETGQRSLLSYVTKPLRDQFNRALRDDAQ